MNSAILKDIPQDVVVVGVTKNHTSDVIKTALANGIRHIAENRVQEAKHKFDELGKSGLVWHLIGHLQTNKARVAVNIFDIIESVDSLHLLTVLNEEAARVGKVQDILFQLNLTQEPQKTGFNMPDFAEALDFLPKFSSIRLRGLMVIAKETDNSEETRPVFRQARNEFIKLQKSFSVDILSMGMSNDYKVAIEEGATEIRLGRALFGERDYSVRF